MALPELRQPAGTPCFLVAGHGIKPDPIHDDFDVAHGHGRKRKIYTSAPRYAEVSVDLSEAQAAAFDDWFENALVVGNEFFTAELARLGETARYWAAQWVGPPDWDPRPVVREGVQQQRWRLSGRLLLTGEGHAEPNLDTVLSVDFGLALLGSARLTSGVSLAIEYIVHLNGLNPLAVEYVMALGPPPPPSFESREDGGHELREDGGSEQRE